MTTSRTTLAAAAVLLPLAAVAAHDLPAIENAGLVGRWPTIQRPWIAYAVEEALQGAGDLNGDGDTLDAVYHVLDTTSGSAFSLNLAIPGNVVPFVFPRRIATGPGFFAFSVDEGATGFTDLNGDGDVSDAVVSIYDAAADELWNVGLAGYEFEAVVGGRVFFGVSESAQGGQDLNGDGDAGDWVVHVADLATRTVTNTGLASTNSSMVSNGTHLLLPVWELTQGGVDLNGDGDAADFVAFAYDVAADSATNLGLSMDTAIQRAYDARVLPFEVEEPEQGGLDLNGDGDGLDVVLHAYDTATGEVDVVGAVQDNFWTADVSRTRIAALLDEASQGADLNGDGDQADWVAHLYDAGTGAVQNLGLASVSLPRFHGRWLDVDVSEADQGVDLTGDGDLGDTVLHVLDLVTGTLANSATSTSTADSAARWTIFRARESDQEADLNGDGDLADSVAHVYDAATDELTNLGWAADSFIAMDAFTVLGTISESGEQSDLNGDGDAIDSVFALVELPDARTHVLGLAFPIPGNEAALRESILVFEVGENASGVTDLNGDGDALDHVLHWTETVRVPASPFLPLW